METIPVVIDRSSPVPLYHQLAEQLTAAIESGTLGPGDAFENELATGAMPAPLIPLPGKPPSAWWIQAGIAQRRDWEPERILAELKESVAHSAYASWTR